jgi:hypothetical protein
MWWDLDRDIQTHIGSVLQEQFEFLFDKLNVKGTRDVAAEVTTRVMMHRERPTEAAAEVEAEEVGDLAD